MKCPSCGSEGRTGKFCSECGTALQITCASCGAELPPDNRFCTRCGEALAGAGSRAGSGVKWPWLVAGGVVVLLVLVFMLPRRTERAGPEPMTNPEAPLPGVDPGGAADAGAGGAPPPLSGDMRTNADRLYNRIMAAAERGDSAEVARFMPMAVQAYRMVDDLDADGLYHLAVLHMAAGDPQRATVAAHRILDENPDHILALGIAGAAALQTGAESQARSFYQRLLEAYPGEAARTLPEYVDHAQVLPEYRRRARETVGPAAEG